MLICFFMKIYYYLYIVQQRVHCDHFEQLLTTVNITLLGAGPGFVQAIIYTPYALQMALTCHLFAVPLSRNRSLCGKSVKDMSES